MLILGDMLMRYYFYVNFKIKQELIYVEFFLLRETLLCVHLLRIGKTKKRNWYFIVYNSIMCASFESWKDKKKKLVFYCVYDKLFR